MKALPNLDFIRAVAVLSVVFSHILLAYHVVWFRHREIGWIGVVGVFVFFVHTSLVLMWSLERKPHTLDFYIRRVFRIYPLAALAILVTILTHAPVGGTPEKFFEYVPYKNSGQLISAFLLIGNLTHYYLPVGVLWTLVYEMQMYVTLPILFFFVRRNFSLWPLLVFWLFIYAECHQLFRGAPHNFFLCIPYFLPGIMAYVGFGRRRPILPALLLPIGLAVLWIVFMFYPGWRQGSWLCLALGLCLPSFRQMTSRWLILASHEVAKYSYSIYLAHSFSLVLGIYLMPHRPVVLQLAVVLISLIVISLATYHLLEKPMIQLGARLAQRAELRFEQHEAPIKRRKPEDRAIFEPRPTE